MSDDLMDARLRAAGERWRSAHAEPVAVDAVSVTAGSGTTEPPPDLAATPGGSRRPRLGLLLSAAAVVAALTLGGVLVLRSFTGRDDRRQVTSAALTGTVWQFVGFGDGSPAGRSYATLHIASDGALVADDD